MKKHELQTQILVAQLSFLSFLEKYPLKFLSGMRVLLEQTQPEDLAQEIEKFVYVAKYR
jgi:hypothetical protein